MRIINLRNNILFYLFMLVIILRVLSNFNLFNYQVSVILPIIFIPLFFLFYYKSLLEINYRKVSKGALLFSFIILNILFTQALQFILYDNLVDENGRSTFSFMLAVSLLAISWFVMGGMLSRLQVFNYYKFFIIAFIALYCTLIISYFNGLFVDYHYLTFIRKDDIKINHLSLTEPLTYILFFLLAIGYTNKLKWISIVITILAFLSLGGRTAFFCFISTIFLYEFILSNVLFFQIKLIFSILVLLFLIRTLNLDDNIFSEKMFFRDGLSSDSSFKGRAEFFLDFFDGIVGQVVIGNPNFFIYKHNDFGTYSHNILSIFQFYGLVAFAIVIFSLVYIIKKIFFLKLIYSKDLLDVFGILMLIYIILSMLVGKSALFGPFWFILGFYLLRLDFLKRNVFSSFKHI